MKYYDIITKRGSTYRVDEAQYADIMRKMSEGKMFVVVNGTPVNVSSIAEMPLSKNQSSATQPKALPKPTRNEFNPNGKGYKFYVEQRDKLFKKLGIKR